MRVWASTYELIVLQHLLLNANINWDLIYFWILNINVFYAISTVISICQFFILWYNFFFSFLKWWSAVCTRLFVNPTWRHRLTSPVTTDVPPTSSTPSTTSKPRGKYYRGWRAFKFLTVQGPPHFWDKLHIHAQTSIITGCQGPLRLNASSKSHGSFKILIPEIFVYFLD